MVKILRTIANQFIIGKVTEQSDVTFIADPYTVQPTMEGLQLSPLDFEIVGKVIKETTIYNSNLIYCTEPSTDIKNSYLQALTGTSEQQLIL